MCPRSVLAGLRRTLRAWIPHGRPWRDCRRQPLRTPATGSRGIGVDALTRCSNLLLWKPFVWVQVWTLHRDFPRHPKTPQRQRFPGFSASGQGWPRHPFRPDLHTPLIRRCIRPTCGPGTSPRVDLSQATSTWLDWRGAVREWRLGSPQGSGTGRVPAGRP